MGNDYGIAAEHARLGGGRGSLGYPTSTLRQDNYLHKGFYQIFERGVIYTRGTEGIAVKGGASPFDATHRAAGGGAGLALGYPVAREVREASGYWYQRFENGVIYVSPRGAHAVPGSTDLTYFYGRDSGHGAAVERTSLNDTHRSNGGGSGILGYPSGRATSQGGPYLYQVFERGVLYCGARNARNDTYGCWPVVGALSQVHRSYGGGSGIGYPIAARELITWATCESGAPYWQQAYERGHIITFASGRYSVLDYRGSGEHYPSFPEDCDAGNS
ncbi:hypothetical protein GCM10025875_17940 [Litorihabitans aurantiacus]|uniref:LGFP repeat-containing protein n=1 Tax=Litorihabitans aurantiacus TaxID=1930061 RepID=A0AA37XES9_9MICO|nr:hypothetical protein GCM10025875_17940 [Litorihabitans aurantiacus]